METNRVKDTSQESLVTKWFAKYFFSKTYKSFDVVVDKQKQINGIDIVAEGSNIDLKAQSSRRYLNNPRPTFSFEISFYNRQNNLMNGWFVSKKDTDQYGLIWIPEANVDNNLYLINDESIQRAEIMLISVNKLREYVSRYATAKQLIDMAQEMRMNGVKHRDIGNDGSMWLTYTYNLFEQPVNIIIRKAKLLELADGYYEVTKSGVRKIK